jgi:hypothetical protein
MSAVTSPSFTFRACVQVVHRPAKQTNGRLLLRANQMSPPATLLNPLNDDIGTMQQCSTPSHGFQCGLARLRMLVVPLSGSFLSSSLKSTGLPRPPA